MNLSDKIFLGAIVGVVVAAAVTIGFGMKSRDEWADNCLKAGGVPFMPRNGRVCLDPKGVVQIP